jgi:ribosomal protein S27AE
VKRWAGFGVKPEAPVASYVKRLRCSNCGSDSVMANRIAGKETAARREAGKSGAAAGAYAEEITQIA